MSNDKIDSKISHTLSWVRDNLFNSWYNTILTVLSAGFIYMVLKGLLVWVFLEARWDVIPENIKLFTTGTYPAEETWRVWLSLYMIAGLAGLSAGIWGGQVFRFSIASASVLAGLAILPFQLTTRAWLFGAALFLILMFYTGRGRAQWRPYLIWGWIFSIPVTAIILGGFKDSSFLPAVQTNFWGGLLLTLFLAVIGIVASFPLGIMFALGRRSDLPAVRWFSTIYIETIRGVPLISILFMSQIMLPIFLPDFRIDKVLRAMIGLILFSTAYMAENIRGGLQGVPQGQYEAARSVGLSGTKTMALIILPQALRSVIPAIVGQFISLFKDTSLVAIIGLLDLLGIARTVIANPDWLGLQAEVYLFVAAIYFIFTYSMSNMSRKVEVTLGVGKG